LAKQLSVTSNLTRLVSTVWGSDRWRWMFVLCALTGMVGGVYLNSLGNDFVNWDDPGLILGHSHIRSLDWSNIKEIFTLRRASTYQPIRVLSYAVDYQFWKLNPLGYHITNIGFYLLTCIMVYVATGELLGFLRAEKTSDSNRRIAFLTAIIFAVHPVHVEAVTWLSSRKEVLLGFFFFASLYWYLRGAREPERTRKSWFYGLALLSFVLAALSKPVAVVLPGIIILFELLRGRGRLVSLWKTAFWLVPVLLVSALVITILLKVMVEAGGVYPYRGGSFLANLLVAFRLFILNIKLMMLEVNFSPIYILILPERIFGLGTWVFVFLNLGLIGFAVFMFRRSRVVSFCVFWFYVTMLPFSNIIPISTPLADRYVFLSSFAYCVLVALGLERLWAIKHERLSRDFFPYLTTALLIGLIAGYAYMTVQQNRAWRNSFTLWSDALAKNPKNPAAMNGLAVIYLDNGMDNEACELLETAVETIPLDPLSHNNLGTAYERLGQYAQSEHHYLIALSLKPDYYEARLNLGLLAFRVNKFEKAIAIFADLLAENPHDATLHLQIGIVYEKAGQLAEAIREYEKTIALTPHAMYPYERLAHLYLEKFNDRQKALHFFQKGIEMAPDSKRVKEIEAEIERLSSERISLRDDRSYRE
jgi:Flp pilus assembly protein TadD